MYTEYITSYMQFIEKDKLSKYQYPKFYDFPTLYISPPYHLRGPWWLPRRDGFILPTSASCSRKLDHSSANDSLLEAPLSMNSVARFGVLGVRRGVPGTRSFPGILDVPGRARPACSRCSVFNHQMGSRNYAFLVCSTDHRSSLGVQRSVAIFGISSDQIGLKQGSVGNGW